MLDSAALGAIGRQLRIAYESTPKGGIPDRIWQLLLRLERKERAAPPLPAR